MNAENQELCDFIAQQHCTLQEVIDKVNNTSSFGYSITHEKALELQADLNRYNSNKPSKICILMGVDEGGYRWHSWGPSVVLTRIQSEELADIFAEYMNQEQRDAFALHLHDLDPFWELKNLQ